MALKHGKVVSRMAAIQEALAVVDHNLSVAFDNSDTVRYFNGTRRVIVTELYQIGDKLSLVKPLSQNLRRAYAYSLLDMANYQELDGEKLDLDLLVKAEHLWAEILREEPTRTEARAMLVGAQRGLADELDARGRPAEALRWRGQSLSTAQGNPELLYQLATVYALNAWFVGKFPSKLDIRQLEARSRRYQEEAVTMLKAAVADGFNDVERFQKQPEFTSFRSYPAFLAVLPDLGACPRIRSCFGSSPGFPLGLGLFGLGPALARTFPLNSHRRCSDAARSSEDCGSSRSVATPLRPFPVLSTGTAESRAPP